MSAKKSKGKGFEDLVADLINDFLLENYPEYKENLKLNSDLRVKRNPNSGSTNSDDGDISLNLGKNLFPFSIECKKWDNLGELNLKQILNPKMPLMVTYKLQCIPQANIKKLKPLLVFRGSRTPIFTFFQQSRVEYKNLDKMEMLFKIPGDYYICLFEEFLNNYGKCN